MFAPACSFRGVVSFALAVGLAATAAAAEKAGDRVRITETADKVRVEIDGKLFTEYCFRGAAHVYFYPLIGPGGARMTRDWPMLDNPGEEHDHPHHRSLWFSHGAVNGVDFWSESAKAGKIMHDSFIEVAGGAESGIIRARHKWVAPDGQVPLTDETTFRVHARPANERLFDFEIVLRAGASEVVLGDTKEGTMAIRLAESMRLMGPKKQPGAGHIVNSEGVRDDATWGKRAKWVDYYGPVTGKTVGVAIFDHPQNPQHPTWWHVRDYGLFAANPFGQHDFEKKPAGAGDIKIPAGGSLQFRYRFYLHEGDEKQAKVAERFSEYLAAPGSSSNNQPNKL